MAAARTEAADPGAPPATGSGATQSATQSAGRGVLFITAAKLYFIVAGYAVQLMLPRLLGSPERFGLYSAAMSVVSILNNVLIVATIQTVSKRVSEDPGAADHSLRQGLSLQAVVGAVLAGTLLVSAPLLAERVLLDALLTPLFRIAAVVVFSYALYAALVGSLNGRQLFFKQATLDVTYTTLRSGCILGGAALGYGALGAIGGFASAAVGVLTVALLMVGVGRSGRPLAIRSWLLLMAPLWLYQLCLNMTLQVDLTVLKRSVADLALSAGQGTALAAETASRFAGFYRAAQTFAFVPYQLILSVTFVVFPMISHAVSIGDDTSTRAYIRGAMRFSFIVLFAVAAPISGASAGVMRIAYPDAYLAGASALSLLSLGMVCFALFVIGATILSGAGRPGIAAAVAAVTVVLVIGLNVLLVRAAGIGEGTLGAAATATSIGTAFALLAIGSAVYMRFGAFIPWKSALRTLLAAGAAWLLSHSLPSDSALSALGALVGGGLGYLVTLALVGELGKTELQALLSVVRRRGS
ncbi:MAG: polysaccharide biosynthesis C-terminal domain-containing protein [Myxococcales bacterium]|nr:polysaccharide biosynthesis C-terminal domain-containing protein [Myxococcales bacterium]